jgi:hypothetical protein
MINFAIGNSYKNSQYSLYEIRHSTTKYEESPHLLEKIAKKIAKIVSYDNRVCERAFCLLIDGMLG